MLHRSSVNTQSTSSSTSYVIKNTCCETNDRSIDRDDPASGPAGCIGRGFLSLVLGGSLFVASISGAAAQELPGDVNGDYRVDATEVLSSGEAMLNSLAGGRVAPYTSGDTDGDGIVTMEESVVVAQNGARSAGDSNLDCRFTTTDLIEAFQGGYYDQDADSNWEQGDWNGDKRTNSADLVLGFQSGFFEKGCSYRGRHCSSSCQPTSAHNPSIYGVYVLEVVNRTGRFIKVKNANELITVKRGSNVFVYVFGSDEDWDKVELALQQAPINTTAYSAVPLIPNNPPQGAPSSTGSIGGVGVVGANFATAVSGSFKATVRDATGLTGSPVTFRLQVQ